MRFDGPARTAAHDMWYYCYYYDVHRSHVAAHVF